MVKKEVKISGMKCEHCVKHMTKALMDISGMERVDVDLGKGMAFLEMADSVSMNEIRDAVEKAGYKVEG